VGIVINGDGDPVPGQRVELYAGAAATGTPLGFAVTDAAGSYCIMHDGEDTTYSIRVLPPLPHGATTVTPDPAVVSLKASGLAAAGIFVID
jgi:hypothetical protein